MENSHTIVDILGTTMGKVREMTDVNTVVGNAIHTPDGSTVIPVSKVSYGFASGGGDLNSKSADRQNFAGGAGAAVKITPVSFLVINGTSVRMVSVTPSSSPLDSILNMVPGVLDKIGSFFDKAKDEDAGLAKTE